MSTIDPISKKAFITVDSELVTLAFPKKTYEFSVSDIRSMHIIKRRPGYFAALMGTLLDFRDTNYFLCVRTQTKDVKIPIDRLQRYYCIKLVGLVRKNRNIFLV